MMHLMYFILFIIHASLTRALIVPTSTPNPMTSTISDPGEILIINGDLCEDCLPTVGGSNAYTNSIVDDTGTTRGTIMYQAAQVVTMLPQSRAAISMDSQPTSIIITSIGRIPSSVDISSKESFASGSTKMLSVTSTHSNLSTGLSVITTAYNPLDSSISETSSSISSKSDAESIRLHPYLYNVLAIYTITFTIFLLPFPAMSLVEFLVISITASLGWILLYFDKIINFIYNPRESTNNAYKSLKFGIITYGIERWYNLQAIRQFSGLASSTPANFPFRIHHLPSHSHLTLPPGPSNPFSAHPFRLDAWWKDDILSSLRKHHLRDYFNPTDFALEKYVGDTYEPQEKAAEAGSVKPWSTRLQEEDIFSSDDELDVSPLTTKLHSANRYPVVYRHDSVAPFVSYSEGNADTRNISDASRETCVDDSLSPREKVSGFISWDALKRQDATTSILIEGEKAFTRIAEKAETESSGKSEEREAMSTAI